MACIEELEDFRSFDLYGIQPVPRFGTKKLIGSVPGLGLSFVTIGIVVSYAVMVITRLVSGDQVSIALHQIRDPALSRVQVMPFEVTLPHLGDPSYFTVLLQHRTAEPGQRSAKIPIPYSFDNDTMKADVASFGIAGDCTVARCEYVRTKIYPCDNTTSTVPCATMDAINDIINRNYMLLTMQTQSVEGEPTPKTIELSLKDALSFRQRFRFNVHDLRISPNYLNVWTTTAMRTLQAVAPVFSIDRLPRLTVGEDAEFCKVDLLLSGTLVKEERTYNTSLDIIGEIAAFFGAVSGFFAIFMTKWNSRNFYNEHPKWQGFDAEFHRPDTAAPEDTAHLVPMNTNNNSVASRPLRGAAETDEQLLAVPLSQQSPSRTSAGAYAAADEANTTRPMYRRLDDPSDML